MALFIDLNLKELCGIIGTLGISTSIKNLQKLVEINGKKYYYEKDGNKFTIIDPEKNQYIVSISYTTKEKEDSNHRKYITLNHDINIDFQYSNGNKIKMENNIPLDPGYEAFEDVQRHHLMKELKLTYNDTAEFNLGLSKITLCDKNQSYYFTKEGIMYGNNELKIVDDTIKKDIPVEVKKLKDMHKALMIRNEIKDNIKKGISSDVLEQISRDFRKEVLEIKKQEGPKEYI